MLGTNTHSGTLQMKSSSGKLTSPTINCTSSYTVTITYTSSKNITLTIGSDSETSGSPLSLTTETSGSNFVLSTGSNAAYISEIKIEPVGTIFAFSATEATAKLGSDFTAPTLTNGYGTAVSYSSSDTGVATVDGEGNVTLVAAGTTTIKATLDADKSVTASYDLTVKEVTSYQFKKITSTDELEDGAKYLIVYETGSKAMGEIDSSNKGTALDITLDKTTNTCTIEDFEGYTLVAQSDGTYAFKYGDNYVAGTAKSSVALDSKILYSSSITDYAKWNITFSTQKNANIANSQNTYYYIQYNNSTDGNGNIFRIYKSTQRTVQLYKAVEESKDVTVTIGASGYTTLYYSDRNLALPEGLTGSVVKFNSETNKLTLLDAYEYDATDTNAIPMGQAVVLHGSANTTYTLTSVSDDGVVFPIGDSTVPNDLIGHDDDQSVTTSDGTYIYFFGYDKTNDVVGFYEAPDKTSYTEKAHKAYLHLPYDVTDSGAKMLTLDFGSTDGIGAVESAESPNSDAIYTLSGMKLTDSNLKPGLYIKQGRKFVVR